MALLNQEIQEVTRKKLADEMQGAVTLALFTQEPGQLILPERLSGQECLFCKETRQLLEEVSSLSDKLRLEIHDFRADAAAAQSLGVDKIPGLAILSDKDFGIRFYGIPSGYEYTSLIEAIIDVSRSRTSLSVKTKETLQALEKDLHIQVFVTPTCPYCSIAVRYAHQFALESPRVRGDMIEATEFPHLANRFNVMGVPKTVVNGTHFIEGAMPEDKFLQEVLKGLAGDAARG